MLNKIYVKCKENLKDILAFFSLIIFALILFIPLPYYVDKPGGLIDAKERVKIDNGYEASGSFNVTYVGELKATIPVILFALIDKDWDIIPENEIGYTEEENSKEVELRNKLYFKEASDLATIVAYTKANKSINITKEEVKIGYVLDNSLNDLKIGDTIIDINGINVNTKKDVNKIINDYDVGSKLSIKVITKDNEVAYRNARTYKENDILYLGVILISNYAIEASPDISFTLSNNEYGPSGGLIMTLEIYNQLTSKDITKGYIIAGTGTIDLNGNVGEIGGVTKKLKGAEKEGADIFLVPYENYEEAMTYAKERKYSIQIIPVNTFSETLKVLENL